MINMPNIQQPNINRWECEDFGLKSGRVALRFWSPNNTHADPIPDPSIVVSVKLSDVAGQSDHVMINPTPAGWDDKITVLRARGTVTTPALANAFTNALNAYRAAPNHAAGLRAIEGTAMADDWVSAALDGT